MKHGKKWWGLTLIGILVAGYVVVDTFNFAYKTLRAKPVETPAVVLGEETVNEPGYQSVHLVNGKIYLGQLLDENQPFVTLKKVYQYQKSGEDWELQFLSEELKINRDNILYFKPLEADSDVVKAIESYK